MPGAAAPEGIGLPFWLLAVWGPTLAAIVLATGAGTLAELLSRALDWRAVAPEAWLVVLLPLALVGIWLLAGAGSFRQLPGPAWLLALAGFHLLLGPLGEEFGWRGTMQARLQPGLGWLVASLAVGAVWFAWHLPLWLVDSPQRAIPLWLFGAHVVAYSVLIGGAYAASAGSLLPAIAAHLTLNLAPALAQEAGRPTPDAWYRWSLLPYAAAALLLALWLGWARPRL